MYKARLLRERKDTIKASDRSLETFKLKVLELAALITSLTRLQECQELSLMSLSPIIFSSKRTQLVQEMATKTCK